MSDQDQECTPTIILLMKELRRATVPEVRASVALELGDQAAATVRSVAESDVGMSYIDWYHGPTPYHLGTSDEPYISRVGVLKPGEPANWTMKEEVPPQDHRLRDAWMSHTAWLYVDALTIGSLGGGHNHLPSVLRIASHFIDDRCALVWHANPQPKRVTLPTPQTIASFRAGVWPLS